MMGNTGDNKDLSKESNEQIEEILIYYFHIVVSKVRSTGSVRRSSANKIYFIEYNILREIKVPIGNGALQFHQ